MPPLVHSGDPAFEHSVTPFDFAPLTRVIFGPGAVRRLGEFANQLGGGRVLIVTDAGLARAGYERRGVEALKAVGLDVVVFHDVHSEPTTDDVERGLAVARSAKIDLIVGFGGGSSMDCAKGINFLLTNGGRMEDYWGVGKATKPMLPMIAVPTTAGTGSEAQSFAIIANSQTHMKMACGDKKAACRVAILDPELTLTMPPAVTAATGIDAISHAIESHVTAAHTTLSQLFSRRAWQLLSRGFSTLVPTLCVGTRFNTRFSMLVGRCCSARIWRAQRSRTRCWEPRTRWPIRCRRISESLTVWPSA